MKKKLITFMLAMSMIAVIGMTGCGKKNEENDTPAETPEQEDASSDEE